MAKSRIEKAVNRTITLFCLKCGGSGFESIKEDKNYRCGTCGAKFSREQLVEAAYEKERPDIEKKAVKAIQKDIDDMLKKTFRM